MPDTRPTLPADVPRCSGVGYEEDGERYWREGCYECLRRVGPEDFGSYTMMSPPSIVVFFCEGLIEASDLDATIRPFPQPPTK